MLTGAPPDAKALGSKARGLVLESVRVTSAARLEELRAEVRYLRNRLALYRAKVYGPRATDLSRLEKLKREYELAESRLRRAEQETDHES